MLEKNIQKQILKYLTIKGIFCWVNKTQGTYDPKRKVFRRNTTTKGISDILGVLPDGKFFAIEVKTRTGRTTEDQDSFIASVNENNGVAFVARGIEDVDKFLHGSL